MREKIAEIENMIRFSYMDKDSTKKVMDKILVLFPANEKGTGLVKTRECNCCERFVGKPWSDCPSCHGTGTIREKVSMEEAAEILKRVIVNHAIDTDNSFYDDDATRIELAKEGE